MFVFIHPGERNNWKLLCDQLLYECLSLLATCALSLLGHTTNSCTGAGFQDSQCQDQSVEWFKGDFGNCLYHFSDWCGIDTCDYCANILQQSHSIFLLWRGTDCNNSFIITGLCAKGIFSPCLTLKLNVLYIREYVVEGIKLQNPPHGS